MKNKPLIFGLLFILLMCGCFYACQQDDRAINGNDRFSRFFNTSDADLHLQAIVSLLKQKNDSTDFATEFIDNYGYPLWGDAAVFREDGQTVYAIPVKSIIPNKEIGAIWFFSIGAKRTYYHIYTRAMADAITRQVGDETEQTSMNLLHPAKVR